MGGTGKSYKHISFGLVRERLKKSYSETGRLSIDAELLLRIWLIWLFVRHQQ